MEVVKNQSKQQQAEKPTYEQLQGQLMQAQQVIASMRMEFQKKLESLNYSNAFQQQQFMMEIIKMKESFPTEMVDKAIHAVDNFWFEDSKEEETNNEEQGQ